MESIGFDLDGVLYNWTYAVHTYLRAHYNYQGSYCELWFNDFHKYSDDFQHYIVNLPDLYYKMFPDKKQLECLNRLAKSHIIFYVTARPEIAKDNTIKFLENYKFPFSENLHFSTDKASVVRLYGLDYFVDDQPKHLMGIPATCLSFLYLQPWNYDKASEFNCINSIEELERIINGRK